MGQEVRILVTRIVRQLRAAKTSHFSWLRLSLREERRRIHLASDKLARWEGKLGCNRSARFKLCSRTGEIQKLVGIHAFVPTCSCQRETGSWKVKISQRAW